jgi:hypothetical protein
LFVTRNCNFGRFICEDDVVHCTARGNALAKEMLCVHASSQVIDLSGVNSLETNTFLLDQCAGLPLALAVAGQRIANLVRIGYSLSDALQNFVEDLRLSANLLHQNFEAFSCRCNSLSDALRASLAAACDCRTFSPVAGTIHQMYSTLLKTEKQEWISVPSLATLWGVSTQSNARKAAEFLASRSLLSMTTRQGVMGIELHSLAHDFCSRQAEVGSPPLVRIS